MINTIKKIIPVLFFLFLAFSSINITYAEASESCSDLGGECIYPTDDCEGEIDGEAVCGNDEQDCCVPETAAEEKTCEDLGGDCIFPGSDCGEGKVKVEPKSDCPYSPQGLYDCCVPETEEEACSDLGGECIGESENCYNEFPNSDCSAGEICCLDGEAPTEGPAQCPEYQEGIGDGFMLLEGHLVPCGRQCDDPGTANDETASCTLCHLFILMKNIFDLILSLFVIVAILVITVGGVLYIVSSGNASIKEKGKKTIQHALTAFGILLLGWLIVYTALNFLAAKSEFLGNGNNWFEFDCDTESKLESGLKTKEPDESDYTYQSEIASQVSDASPELQEFLSALKDKLPAEAKVISSISDSHGYENCVGDNYDPNNCAHSENSCHYGGETEECREKGSYAVDFGNEDYYSQIRNAAKSVEPEAYVLFESNHVHVSIGAANGCGCN